MRATELFTPRPTKGATPTGHTLIAFDAVRPCMAEDCKLYGDCPYVKRGKCTVEMKYLEAIQSSIFKDIGLKMTQSLQNKISLLLMPLYQQLIRLKMEAYTVEEVVYKSKQGALKVNPIYNEIRATIRSIQSFMEHLGMSGDYLDAIEASPGEKPVYNPNDGMAGYTAALAKKDAETCMFPDGKQKKSRRRMTLDEARRRDEERKARAQAVDADYEARDTKEFDENSDVE